MTEADIMRAIMRQCSVGTCRLMRNNVGKLPDAQGRWVTYGLGVGSADLIGISMQADGIGRFVCIEVKVPGKRATKEQQSFIDMVRKMGGLAGVAHSVNEAHAILNPLWNYTAT
jgi:hypothetical protein